MAPGVGVGAIYLVGVNLSTWYLLRALTFFREYALRGVCTSSTLSISRFCTLDIACTLKDCRVSILRVHICLCFRVSALLVLSVLSVVGLSQYWQHCGRQDSNTLGTRTMDCSRASTVTVKPLFHPERQETFILWEYILYEPNFTQPFTVRCRNLVDAASIGLIAAGHLLRINNHLPIYPISTSVAARIPHYFYKQQYIVCPQKVVCVFLSYLLFQTGVQVCRTSIISFLRHPPRHLPEGILLQYIHL